MKVIQINAWYGVWSTGKIVKNIQKGLQEEGVECLVLYGRGKRVGRQDAIRFTSRLEPKINSFFSRLTGIMYGGCCCSTKHLINILKREKPNIVHLHCVNSFIANNYKLFNFLGRSGIKTVITLHAEYPYTGNCSHALECMQWVDGCKKCPNFRRATRSIFFDNTKRGWKKMYNSTNQIPIKNRRIVAVSGWLKERAELSRTFRADKIEVVFNGLDTKIYNKLNHNINLGIEVPLNAKMCLFSVPDFSTSKSDIKGCVDFLKIVDMMKTDNVLFLVVGNNKNGFDFSNLKNVIYLGPILDETKMAEIYSFCDVTLLLSKRETYSMVTAESISCGTPIVGFKAGAPETIAAPGYGYFVDREDFDGLVSLIKTVKKDNNNVSDLYSYKTMAQKYLEIYRNLLK